MAAQLAAPHPTRGAARCIAPGARQFRCWKSRGDSGRLKGLCFVVPLAAAAVRRHALPSALEQLLEDKSRDESRRRQDRTYANKNALRQTRLGNVSLEDVYTPTESSYGGLTLKASVFVTAFFAYPWLVGSLREQVTDPQQISDLDIISDFVTVETLFYSGFIGVTLSVLLQRLADLQANASSEASVLASLAHRTVYLFSCPDAREKPAIDPRGRVALQALWEYSTTLALRSRADEVLQIANSNLIGKYKDQILGWYADRRLTPDLPQHGGGAQVEKCISLAEELGKSRASRLSRESLALPPTLFITLIVLSFGLCMAFAVRAAREPGMGLDLTSRCAFSALVLGFVVLYKFASDLNQPFRGDYQIRRSGITSELASARLVIQRALGQEIVKSWE